MNRRWLSVILVLGTAMAFGGRLSFEEHAAVHESLLTIPPKMRMEWLHARGVTNSEARMTNAGATVSDSGLRLVGKWGRGPAVEVTGKDTLVVLTLGSEVALLNFAEPDSPVVLSEIQFPSLTAQSYLVDSLLYTSSSSDIEVWNVANPARPVKVGQLDDYPNEQYEYLFGGFWIRDTFLFYIGRDTFHVLSVADPGNMYRLGSCVDSGSVTTGSGNTVVVNQNGGYAFVDVSNPASPHQVGSYPCGRTAYFTAAARGNLVCASYEESGYPYPTRFITLDISDPSSPRLLAKLNDLGGYGIFLDGPLAFVSGGDQSTDDWLPFQILSIADSAHPALIDSLRTTNDYGWAVWENADLERVFIADRYDGLAVVDIHNLNNAVLDTWVLKTGSAVDVHVDGNTCYVAGQTDGFRMLDVTDPRQPVFLSGLDTSFTDASNYSVIARDSFAFVCWRNPYFRVVSMTDPLHPQMVAACALFSQPEDMVLRDSLAYCANNYSLQIVNVARPREPVLVGTCPLSDYVFGMDMSDTLVYLTFLYDAAANLQVVDVARPDSPEVIGVLPMPYGAAGVTVMDTFAYVASGNLYIASVADPTSPRLIDSLILPTFGWSVAASDSFLFIGSSSQMLGGVDDIRVYDIANPAKPVSRGSLPAPDVVERLSWVEPYLYAACGDAGVLIAETADVGIAEPQQRDVQGARPLASVATGVLFLEEAIGKPQAASLLDVGGRKVMDLNPGANDVRALAPGVYFVREAQAQAQAQAVRKIILTD